MSRTTGLYKIVDVTEADDAYSPVVTHQVEPWNRDAMEGWVNSRLLTDPRTMKVVELSGEELLAVFPEAMALAGHWGKTKAEVVKALTYVEEETFCECDAGACSSTCNETGSCDESCYEECHCPQPPERPDLLEYEAILGNYRAFLRWMTMHTRLKPNDDSAKAMKKRLLELMKEQGLR